jgi:hypothetical protein
MRMTVHNWDFHPKLTEGGVVGMCGVVSLQLFSVSDWRARQVIHKVPRESAMHAEIDHS